MLRVRPSALLLCALLLVGCGTSRHRAATSTIPAALLSQARAIGRGPRFDPPATGPVLGSCRPRLGARTAAHVEVFAENRVVLIAAGIGTRPRPRSSVGRITAARCYGELVTLDSTGVVFVRRGLRLTLSALFRSWGEPLSPARLASFSAPRGTGVAVFVDGRRRPGPPGDVPLTEHAEIVVEVGPYVPPHRSYLFSPVG